MKILAIYFFCSAVAFAACVNGNPTVHKEYKSSMLVFRGKVMAQHTTAASSDGYFLDGDAYTVVPTHLLKAATRRILELFSENSPGRFPMQLNQECLLFVYSDYGRLPVDNCGNSGLSSRTNTARKEVAQISGQQ